MTFFSRPGRRAAYSWKNGPDAVIANIRLRAFALVLLLFCVAIVAVRWFELISSEDALRRDAVADLGQRAEQIAAAVAREMDSDLRAVDLALRDLRHDYLTERPREFLLSLSVATQSLGDGSFTGFLATDREGRIRFSSVPGRPTDPDLSGRDYFRALSAGGGDRVIVGQPVEGRFTDGWVIPLARPALNEGRFEGVVAIGIHPEFFATHLDDMGLKGDDVVAIVLTDGTYLARSPGMAQALGRRLPADRPFLAAGAPDRGSASFDAYMDGRRRTFGWRRLADFSVVAVVGLDERGVLGPIEEAIRRTRTRAVVGDILVLVLGLAGALLLLRIARQQKALQQSEERLRAVLNTVNEGIAVSDRDARIILANPAAEKILGSDPGQIPGTDPRTASWDPIHADGTPFTPETHPQVVTLTTGKSQHDVIMGLRRPDGRRIWIQIDTEPLILPGDAKPYAVVGSFTDVTGRLETARKVGLMASVFANTTEGVFIADAEGRILEVNAAFTVLTGFAAADVVGKDWGLLDGEVLAEDRFVQRMAESLAAEGSWREEVPMRGATLLFTASAVRDDAGKPTSYVGLLADVSHLKENEQRLRQMAHFDALTGLPNRILLKDRLDQALARAERAGEVFAVCFLDLDGFKDVNDQFGHEAGDLLLKEVATRLLGVLRHADTVARMGGDEFVILLLGLEWPGDADAILGRVMHAVAAPYDVQGSRIDHISASIGVACFPQDATDSTQLTQRADMAMYAAKRAGRHCIRRYESS